MTQSLKFGRKHLDVTKKYTKPAPVFAPPMAEQATPRLELKRVHRVLIDPEFDVETRTWFYVNEERNINVEAPSIRELLRKLPQRCKVRGYYPMGFEGRR